MVNYMSIAILRPTELTTGMCGCLRSPVVLMSILTSGTLYFRALMTVKLPLVVYYRSRGGIHVVGISDDT